jgi:hypothetical protein
MIRRVFLPTQSLYVLWVRDSLDCSLIFSADGHPIDACRAGHGRRPWRCQRDPYPILSLGFMICLCAGDRRKCFQHRRRFGGIANGMQMNYWHPPLSLDLFFAALIMRLLFWTVYRSNRLALSSQHCNPA